MSHLYPTVYLATIVMVLTYCSERNKSSLTSSTDSTTKTASIPDKDATTIINDSIKNQKLKVLVVQCSNGYEYTMFGYDFNPVIEEALKKKTQIEVVPFSLKKLLGVTYQGVYDKKYCKPIMDKIPADYMIMTRFTGPRPDHPGIDSLTWGYETKILNTKTMNQKVSIGATGFRAYKEIEGHIRETSIH